MSTMLDFCVRYFTLRTSVTTGADNATNITGSGSLIARGRLQLTEPDHEPRIYVAAPSGVLVVKLKVSNVDDPKAAILFRLHEDSLLAGDVEYFKIDVDSGNLTTKRYIDRPVGSVYHIIVAAYSNGETEYINLSIRVTEYNKHPPHFRTLNYRINVELITAVGTTITRVHAIDNDDQAYNAEVYYYVQSRTNLITVNRTTGIVSLKESLSPRYRDLVFTIVAYDGGSPRRQAKTRVTLTVKIISAPRGIGVKENGDQWAMLCWSPPPSGAPLGYIIYLTSMTDFMPRISSQRNVSKEELGLREDRICTSLADLESWSDFEARIAGWDFHEIGMISEVITFDTKVNRTCYSLNNSEYKCSCLAGFYGDNCSMFNPCSSTVSPCQNGGTCTSIADNHYECKCRSGYHGTSCEHFDPCSLATCMNGAECYNISTTLYGCKCQPGYTGKLCELDIDECSGNPCNNGGKCIDGISDFKCVCLPGFKGEVCEINVDDCASSPCQNGATCEDRINNFKCECPVGFEGLLCNIEVNECQSNPCENNGTCIDHTGGYSCECGPGYEGDYCEDEINECTPWPCVNGGSCTDGFNHYTCHCPPGFTGKHCEIHIELCVSSPCKNGGTCSDNTGFLICGCPSGYNGAFCQLKEHCPAEVLKTSRGLFEWPEVEFGYTVKLECPYGLTSDITVLASEYPMFPSSSHYYPNTNLKTDNLTALRYKRFFAPLKVSTLDKEMEYSSTSDKVNAQKRVFLEKQLRFSNDGKVHSVRTCLLLNGTAVWGDVLDDLCKEQYFTIAEELSLHLQNLTKVPSQVNVNEFLDAASQVRHILAYASSDRKIAQGLVSIMSNMLKVNDSVLAEADKIGNTSMSLVNAVDTLTREVQLQPNSVVKLSSPNLAVKIISVGIMQTTDGVSYSPEYRDTELAEMIARKKHVRIYIPQGAMRKAATDGSVRVQFVLYSNRKFFVPRGKSLEHNDGSLFQEQVITVSLGRTHLHNLVDPLIFEFQSIYGDKKQLCVYWDGDSMEWLTSGITTNQSDGWIRCESIHLTAFSVLLDQKTVKSTATHHKATMIAIGYVGALLSITGLFFTILTYSIFRSLNRDLSGKILLNLCVSLLLTNVSYLLLSVKETIDFHKVKTCIVVALSAHYFVLTSLAWMLVEAINMYQLLFTVLASSEKRFMIKRIVLAWGLPLCVVLGTIYTTGINYYKSEDTEWCIFFPSDVKVYYATFLGPACLILLVTTIVFLMVSRVLCGRRTVRNMIKNQNAVIASQVRGAFTVMTLLGVTWIFGFFAVRKFRLMFQYVFSVANSLQGFIIFVARCLQYPEARNAWIAFFRTGELKSHRGVKTGGTFSALRQTTSSSQRTRSTSSTKSAYVDRPVWGAIGSRSNRERTQGMRAEIIRPSYNVIYFTSLTLPHANTIIDSNAAPNVPQSRSLYFDNNICKEGADTSWQFLVIVSTRDQGYGTAEHSPESPRQQPRRQTTGLRLSVSTPEWLHSSHATENAMAFLSAHSDSDIAPTRSDFKNSHVVIYYPPRRESNETSTCPASHSSNSSVPSPTPSSSTSPTISPTPSFYGTKVGSNVPLVDACLHKIPRRIHREELL